MEIKMALSLILCLGFLFLPLAKTNQTIVPVLQSLERLVDFFQSDFKNLNIDGLFGLRVLEGHFDMILQKHESHKLDHLDSNIVQLIRAMKLKLTKTADLAIQHVKKDDFPYYKQLSFVVGSPWLVFANERHQVDPTLIWPQDTYHHAKKTVKLDERVSDSCMSELIGSHKVNGTRCDISTDCLKTMTHPGLVGYGITHQILWVMLGEKAGCKKEIEKKILQSKRGTLASFQKEMCTNNFYQLKETLNKMDNNLIIPAFQDLFLEQLFICPSLGFYEFLHLEFLPQILSWQLKQGCFGKMKKSKNPVELEKALKGHFAYDYDDDFEEFTKMLEGIHLKNVVKDGVLMYKDTSGVKVKQNKVGAESWEISNNKGRKLLVEKEMTDGCLAHKTAVASGALAMYLRFLCEPDADVTFNLSSRIARSSSKIATKTGEIKANNLKPQEGYLEKIKPDKPNNMMVNAGLDMQNNNILNAAKVVNGGPDVKNDMSDLNHHLNQLNAPDLNEERSDLKITNQNLADGYERAINKNAGNTTIMKIAAHKNLMGADQGDKNDEDEDQDAYYDGNRARDDHGIDDVGDDDDDDDDLAADEDEDEKEEDYDNDQDKEDKNNDNDDDYYDERDDKQKKFPGAVGVNAVRNNLNDFNENNFKAGNEIDDVDNDNEYDAGYDDNDRNNVDAGVHAHINLRNIGRHDYRLNDGGFNDDKHFNVMPDYKYKNDDDDEEDEEDDDAGDDYEYDDENDEMAKRRQEELKGDVQFEETVKKINPKIQSAIQSDILHGGQTLSPKTAFFVFGFCISLVLILMYKFIKKRRIRIRFNPKYFSV